MLEVVEIDTKVAEVAAAYWQFVVGATPHTLLALARGAGVGVRFVGREDVEICLTDGTWGCPRPIEDNVDDYLENLIHSLPIFDSRSPFDLDGCIQWVRRKGINALDIGAFVNDFPKSKREQYVQALLFSNADVTHALKCEMLSEFEDVMQVFQDQWEFSLEDVYALD